MATATTEYSGAILGPGADVPEFDRARATRLDLAASIRAALPADGRVEPVAGLTLARASAPTPPFYGVPRSCFCVVAQGAKELRLGEDVLRYDPFHYLLVSTGLPVVGSVVEASAQAPYLGLRLELDPAVVSQVIVEAGQLSLSRHDEPRPIDVSRLSAELLDASLRLVRAATTPRDTGVLVPMITREIVFRLLQMGQSERLRHMARLGQGGHRITEAIRRLYESFDQAVRIEDLAAGVGMSPSAFYPRFKAVTGMTPLQFQKEVRLQAARRLLQAGELDAATAGYQVGYSDPSHFSREYRRLFGMPPGQDAERWRR